MRRLWVRDIQVLAELDRLFVLHKTKFLYLWMASRRVHRITNIGQNVPSKFQNEMGPLWVIMLYWSHIISSMNLLEYYMNLPYLDRSLYSYLTGFWTNKRNKCNRSGSAGQELCVKCWAYTYTSALLYSQHFNPAFTAHCRGHPSKEDADATLINLPGRI